MAAIRTPTRTPPASTAPDVSSGPPRWLDAREERAWRAFTRLRIELGAALTRRLSQRSGLSEADYAVLVHLSESPEDRLRAFELGRVLQWEKSRLSHQLKRMTARGLVDRQSCPTDLRGSFVVLTPEGRAAIEAAAPGHVEDVRQLFVDALDAGQLEALAEIAEALLVRLDQAGDLDPGCED